MTLLRGVMRSKKRALQWARKAAENGHATSCFKLASGIYRDKPYAREVGHVVEAAGVTASTGVMAGHDVPPGVLTDVLQWLQNGGYNQTDALNKFRSDALVGDRFCCNDGCEVVGLLKDFKVCPQCKTARYCGEACQKQDWTSGGHKATCGTCTSKMKQGNVSAPAQAV